MFKHSVNLMVVFCSLLVISEGYAGTGVKAEKNFFIETYKPGMGFFRNAMYPIANKCLVSNKLEVSNYQSQLSLSKSTNISTIAQSLNIDLDAKAGWGKFSGTAAIKYLNQIKEDNYSISFNYQNKITGDVFLDTSEYYGENALTEPAKQALSRGIDSFLSKCGDEYISGLKMGASLTVSMKMIFKSQADKRLFESKVTGDIGDANSVSLELKKLLESNSINGSIAVYAIQSGGDPDQLATMMSNSDENTIAKCDLQNIDQCIGAFSRVIQYASASGPWKEKGFAKQIRLEDGKLIANSLAVVDIADAEFGTYEQDFGLPVTQVKATKDVYDSRIALNKLYDSEMDTYDSANSIAQSEAFNQLDSDIRKYIFSLIKITRSNLATFRTSGALRCFLPSSQYDCPQIVQDITDKIEKYDISKLELLRDSYFFSVNHWPYVLVKNKQNQYDFYTVSLFYLGTTTHSFRVTPAIDYSYLSLGGGFSTFDTAGIQTRHYMDYYGSNCFIYKTGNYFHSIVPWNTCTGGVCKESKNDVVLIPF